MKKLMTLMAIVLLVCVPVWAMALTVTTSAGTPAVEGTDYEVFSDRIELYTDDMTISGSSDISVFAKASVTTLTLRDVDIVSTEDSDGLWMQYDGETVLKVEGNNNRVVSSEYSSAAIWSSGSLKVYARAPLTTEGIGYGSGMMAVRTLTIGGPEKINVLSEEGSGIFAFDCITLDEDVNLEITVSGDGEGISGDGGFVMKGGEVRINNGYRGVYLNGGGLKIQGGKLTATSAVAGLYARDDIIISDANVELTGGLYGMMTDETGDIVITDSVVVAEGSVLGVCFNTQTSAMSVAGDSDVIAYGTEGIAVAVFLYDDNAEHVGTLLADVTATDNLTIRVGESEETAEVADAYSEENKYLRIHPWKTSDNDGEGDPGTVEPVVPQPPKTGDSAPVFLWMSMLLLAAAGAVLLMRRRAAN